MTIFVGDCVVGCGTLLVRPTTYYGRPDDKAWKEEEGGEEGWTEGRTWTHKEYCNGGEMQCNDVSEWAVMERGESVTASVCFP